jgi:dUTP pyrophosphatase
MPEQQDIDFSSLAGKMLDDEIGRPERGNEAVEDFTDTAAPDAQGEEVAERLEEISKDLAEQYSGNDAGTAEQITNDFSGQQALEVGVDVVRPLVKVVQPQRGYVVEVPVQVKKLPNYKDLPDLAQATVGSVGVDLYAAIDKPILLNKVGVQATVPTGIAISIPAGFEGQIRPRSGIAKNYGVTVLNTPATIDSDYRGEVRVLLTKVTTDNKMVIERGMRIAQLVIAPVVVPRFEYVEELDRTERGAGGFGHSGI